MVVEIVGGSGGKEQIWRGLDEQDQRAAKCVVATGQTPCRLTRRLISTEHFTPYQLILGTFTIMYALRHLDDLFGLGGEWPSTSRAVQLMLGSAGTVGKIGA